MVAVLVTTCSKGECGDHSSGVAVPNTGAVLGAVFLGHPLQEEEPNFHVYWEKVNFSDIYMK